MIKKTLVTISKPNCAVSESYKIFQTNLDYLNKDGERSVLLFTSAIAEDGKSIALANTAVSCAQSGKRVLIIDADLRNPKLHDIFKTIKVPGLANLLNNGSNLEDVIIRPEGVNHLELLTAGTISHHPIELLYNHALYNLIKQARSNYDIVFLNSPPVLSVSDVAIMNKWVDGTILIISKKETNRENIRLAKDALLKMGANFLGVLLTNTDSHFNNRHYYSNI